MKVLVAWASRHGSTTEIAEAAGDALRDAGFDVDVRELGAVDTVYPYDACVLGSAVYMGSWLREAKQFADEHFELLQSRPVWLFSSGPIGEIGAGADAFDAAGFVADLHAIDHALFDGRLDRTRLRFGERSLVRAMRVADGDHRDWDAVAAWAGGIARTLSLVSAR
jgi:menaquinone-dependent protoporphyrinogen oxidase